MKKIVLFVLFACCITTPIAVTGCGSTSPTVQHAVAAGEACAKQDVLQPLEGQGMTLLEKVSSALLAGAGKTAIDDGVSQAKADLGTLPATLEAAAVDCAIKTAIAAYAPLTTGHGFAGGDARLTEAVTIGQRLLAERGAGGS